LKISLTAFAEGAAHRVRDVVGPNILTPARLASWIRESIDVDGDAVGRQELLAWLHGPGRNAASGLHMTPRGLATLAENLPDLELPKVRVDLPPARELASLETIAGAAPPEERVLALNGLWNAMLRSPGPMVDSFDVVLTLDAGGFVQASTPRGNPGSARVHLARFAAWLSDTPEGGDFARRHPSIAAAFAQRLAA
jgi:hypothetical protein